MKWSRALGIGVFLALAMPAWIALTGIGDRAFSQLLPDGVAAAMTIGWSLLALPVLGLWLYGRLFGNAASATSPASPPPSPFALHVDGDGVALRRKREPVGAVAWDDILGVDLFTTDEAQAARVADKIDAGMVYVNCVLADSPELPFGGIKRSGSGRELGTLGIDEFVNKKMIRVA